MVRKSNLAFIVFFIFLLPALIMYQALGWVAASFVLAIGVFIAIRSAQKTS